MRKNKKNLFILAGLLIAVFITTSIVYAFQNSGVVGDVNIDKEFDVRDLVRMKRYLSGIESLKEQLFYSNDFTEGVISAPDPYILYDNGLFYLYYTETSGGVLQAYRSENLDDWESLGVIYQRDSDYWGNGRFWAPKVIKNPKDNKYYMYTSCSGDSGIGLPEGTSLDSSSEVYASPILERLHLTVLVADNPAGPFKEWTGARTIEKFYHGESMGQVEDNVTLTSGPIFDFANAPTAWNTNKTAYASNGTNIFAQLDPYPFFDEDGTMYLYFVRSRDFNGAKQGIWGVKMIDMVTPDYSTLTCLTEPGYYAVGGWKSTATMDDTVVNEGCCMQRHTTVKADGTEVTRYYLTYSRSGFNCPYYSTCVAVADHPLGYQTPTSESATGLYVPKGGFWKLPARYGNPVHYIDATQDTTTGAWSADANYDLFQSTGNSMFFKVGEEEFLVSLCTEKVTGQNARSFVIDRVAWQYNKTLGYDVPHSNGPTQGSLQPRPSAVTGYENLAKHATITGSNSENVGLLNDGYVAIHKRDDGMVYYANKDECCITISLAEAKQMCAVMVYNAYDESKAFAGIDKIEFIEDNNVVKTITDVRFPTEYLTSNGELRPGGAAVSVFGETTADIVKIYISETMISGASQIGIAEIVLLGKE